MTAVVTNTTQPLATANAKATRLHGLLAEFETPGDLMHAA